MHTSFILSCIHGNIIVAKCIQYHTNNNIIITITIHDVLKEFIQNLTMLTGSVNITFESLHKYQKTRETLKQFQKLLYSHPAMCLNEQYSFKHSHNVMVYSPQWAQLLVSVL